MDLLEQRLQDYYAEVPPAPGGLLKGRELFMAEAARRRTLQPAGRVSHAVAPRPRGLALAYRLVALVMIAILGIGAAGGGVALAASDSLPGDLLYPVKWTVEDIQLSLTKDPAAQAERTMSFVNERVDEVSMLVSLGDVVPNEPVQRMLTQMEQVMEQIALSQPEEAPGLLAQYAETMRVQQLTLAKVQGESHEKMQLTVYVALEAMEQVYANVEKAQTDPVKFQYQQRVVKENPGEVPAGPEPAQKPVAPPSEPPAEPPIAEEPAPAQNGNQHQNQGQTPAIAGGCEDCDPVLTGSPLPNDSPGQGPGTVSAPSGAGPGPGEPAGGTPTDDVASDPTSVPTTQPQGQPGKSDPVASGDQSDTVASNAPAQRSSASPPRMRRRVIPLGY